MPNDQEDAKAAIQRADREHHTRLALTDRIHAALARPHTDVDELAADIRRALNEGDQ